MAFPHFARDCDDCLLSIRPRSRLSSSTCIASQSTRGQTKWTPRTSLSCSVRFMACIQLTSDSVIFGQDPANDIGALTLHMQKDTVLEDIINQPQLVRGIRIMIDISCLAPTKRRNNPS